MVTVAALVFWQVLRVWALTKLYKARGSSEKPMVARILCPGFRLAHTLSQVSLRPMS